MIFAKIIAVPSPFIYVVGFISAIFLECDLFFIHSMMLIHPFDLASYIASLRELTDNLR